MCLYLLVFVYGAAPAEARYKISGVRKASVPALRSFLKNQTNFSNTCFDIDENLRNTEK